LRAHVHAGCQHNHRNYIPAGKLFHFSNPLQALRPILHNYIESAFKKHIKTYPEATSKVNKRVSFFA
jgi:hypothetical protein